MLPIRKSINLGALAHTQPVRIYPAAVTHSLSRTRCVFRGMKPNPARVTNIILGAVIPFVRFILPSPPYIIMPKHSTENNKEPSVCVDTAYLGGLLVYEHMCVGARGITPAPVFANFAPRTARANRLWQSAQGAHLHSDGEKCALKLLSCPPFIIHFLRALNFIIECCVSTLALCALLHGFWHLRIYIRQKLQFSDHILARMLYLHGVTLKLYQPS